MDFRKYVSEKIERNKRIIEFGPLNRPSIKKDEFKNVFYADVKSRKEIIDLYTGNEYLKNTGIKVDTNSIVDIDYVINKNYKTTFKNVEKFDYAVLSHVIEHMPDILFFFKDLENILKEKGKVIIIYPDSRYCFDHYRNEVSFRDAYATYTEGTFENSKLAFDFILNVVKENSSYFFWNDLNISDRMNSNAPAKAVKAYQNTKKGIFLDDVHYWPFSDYGFLKFLYEGKHMGLINFDLVEFYKTEKNTQEFMAILEYNKKQDDSNFKYIRKLLDELDPVIKEAKLVAKLAEKDNQLLQAKKEMDDKSTELLNVYNSKSWRYTNLLRKALAKIRGK